MNGNVILLHSFLFPDRAAFFFIVSFLVNTSETKHEVSIFRGDMHPALWGAKVGNSWRTTNDISDTWNRYSHLQIKNVKF